MHEVTNINYSIRSEIEVLKRIDSITKKLDRSRNYLINKWIEEGLKRDEKKLNIEVK